MAKSKTPSKKTSKPAPPVPESPPAEPGTCVCGCSEDDHGHDPEYPGSSACNNCGDDCIAYEADEGG